MTPRYTLLLLIAAFLVGGPGGPGFSHLTVLYTKEGYDSGLLALLTGFAGNRLLARRRAETAAAQDPSAPRPH